MYNEIVDCEVGGERIFVDYTSKFQIREFCANVLLRVIRQIWDCHWS